LNTIDIERAAIRHLQHRDDARHSIGVRRAFHLDFAQREQGVAMMISAARDLSRMTADGRERDVS